MTTAMTTASTSTSGVMDSGYADREDYLYSNSSYGQVMLGMAVGAGEGGENLGALPPRDYSIAGLANGDQHYERDSIYTPPSIQVS